jgi:chromosome partitioning protein
VFLENKDEEFEKRGFTNQFRADKLDLSIYLNMIYQLCSFAFMTSPTIITCASSKGGVGKSTTAACLAGAFAYRGDTVHIVDLDSNKTLSRWFGDDTTRPRGITVATPAPTELTDHIRKISTKNAPDIIVIDIAGAYESAMTVAVARATLTIIPSTLAEADVFEASKVAHLIQQIFARFQARPLYRLLLTKVQPLKSHAQRHAYNEIQRLQIPMLDAMLVQRAAYEEIGLSGLPPHYGDRKRQTIAASVKELDGLMNEIQTLIDLSKIETIAEGRIA